MHWELSMCREDVVEGLRMEWVHSDTHSLPPQLFSSLSAFQTYYTLYILTNLIGTKNISSLKRTMASDSVPLCVDNVYSNRSGQPIRYWITLVHNNTFLWTHFNRLMHLLRHHYFTLLLDQPYCLPVHFFPLPLNGNQWQSIRGSVCSVASLYNVIGISNSFHSYWNSSCYRTQDLTLFSQ